MKPKEYVVTIDGLPFTVGASNVRVAVSRAMQLLARQQARRELSGSHHIHVREI